MNFFKNLGPITIEEFAKIAKTFVVFVDLTTCKTTPYILG